MSTVLEDKIYALQARLDALVSGTAYGGFGVPQQIRRKPGGTARTSTTTLANDPDMYIVMAANARYHIVCLCIAVGAAQPAGGFQFAFRGPTGSVARLSQPYFDNTNAVQVDQLGITADVGVLGSRTVGTSTNVSIAMHGMFICGGTAGNMTLQWAQQASSTTPTTLQGNSYVAAWQLS